MFERAAPSACLLAMLSVTPTFEARAQSVDEYTRRVDSVGRIWRASATPTASAPADPQSVVASTPSTIDTVRVGHFVVFTDPALAPLARRAAEEIGSSLDSAYGRFASELEKHPLRLRRRPPGDTTVVETGFADGTAVRMGSTSFANPHDLAVTWRRKAEELVTLALDTRARTWLAAVVPSEKATERDFAKGRVELVLSGASSASDCAAGNMDRCKQTLELVPVADPAFAHYDATARRGLLQRFASQLRRADEPKYLRCMDETRVAVCDSLLRSIPLDAVPRPLSPAVRQSFLQYVFLLGGSGAFERFASDTGSIADRVASSARLPFDTVVARWQHAVIDASGTSTAVDAMTVVTSLAWACVFGALALRSSRWR